MFILVAGFFGLFFLIFLLYIFWRSYHDESERISHLLANEVAELEKLSFEDLESFCAAQPRAEVRYDEQKFIRLIEADTYDDNRFISLHVKVTVCGTMFRSLRETAEFTKERKLVPGLE